MRIQRNFNCWQKEHFFVILYIYCKCQFQLSLTVLTWIRDGRSREFLLETWWWPSCCRSRFPENRIRPGQSGRLPERRGPSFCPAESAALQTMNTNLEIHKFSFFNTVCFIRPVQITLWQDQKRNMGRGKWMFAKRFFPRHFIIQTYSYILCFHLNIDGTFTSFKSSQFVSPGIGCWSKALLLSYSWFWKTTFVNWDSSKILSASWNEVTMKWGRVE